MSQTQIIVLGGSSPFTAGLVSAIVEAGDALPPSHLVLQGRSTRFLNAVAAHARARLGPRGWTVRAVTSRQEALDGADVVIHQTRYGGLEEREAGERLASSFSVPADETLGPAALQSALRSEPELAALERELSSRCPDAWILNLTNPLSFTTAVLSRGGLRCVGLCELPLATMQSAARCLGLDPRRVEWHYSGLNHRGFIHALVVDGDDRIADLAAGAEPVNGIAPAEIAALGAIPLKYFTLLSTGRAGPSGTPGRAGFLSDLRERMVTELEDAPAHPPSGLLARSLVWYPLSVVPFLLALSADDGREEIVNVLADDGIVREMRSRVFRRGLEPVPAGVPPLAVSRWIDTFARHERAVLEATRAPSKASISAALAADPLGPERLVDAMTAALMDSPPTLGGDRS